MAGVRITRVVMLTAATQMLIGVGSYALPLPMGQPALSPIVPAALAAPATLMGGGLLLLISARYPMPLWLRRLLMVLGTLPLLGYSGRLALTGLWPSALLFGLAAAVTLAGVWLPSDERVGRPDLAAVALSLALAALGGLALILPSAFLAVTAGGGGPSPIPLRPWFGAFGLLALAGAAATLWPARGGPWGDPAPPWRRLPGALALAIVIGVLVRSGHWIGAFTWGIWLAALLVWDRVGVSASVLWTGAAAGEKPSPGVATRSPGRDHIAPETVEQALETAGWLLALLVVGLSGIYAGLTATSPLGTSLFVLALTGYNTMAHWILPNVGAPPHRVFWHLTVLAVSVGLLHMMDPGPVAQAVVVVLVVIPPLAAQVLDPASGRALLLLVLGMLGAAALGEWQLHGVPGRIALGKGVAEVVLLAAAATWGMNTVARQRRLLQDLAAARGDLQRQVDQLAMVSRIGDAIRRSLDLDENLQTTVTELGQVLGVSRCYIRVRSAEHFQPVAYEYTAPGVVPVSQTPSHTVPPLLAAAETRRPTACTDIRTDPRMRAFDGLAALLDLNVVATLAAPILAEGQVLGVLVCHQCDRSRDWLPEEVDLVVSLAGQVGVAILHARHHRSVVQANAELLTVHQDLRESNDRLARANDMLQAMIRSSPLPIVVLDTHWQVQRWNPAAERLFGWSEHEVLGRPCPIVTPGWPAEFAATVGRALRAEATMAKEDRCRRRDGTLVDVSISTNAFHDAEGRVVGVMSIIEDITDRKRNEAQLIFLAHHDALTGVMSRRRFLEALEHELSLCRRHGTCGALLFLDLDGFKAVNDTYGHSAGDRVLRTIAGAIRNHLRETDQVARLGGDEFAVLLPFAGVDEAITVARKLQEMLMGLRLRVAGPAPPITISIGIAVYPDHGLDVDQLLSQADTAMYQAKQSGRNRYVVFSPTVDDSPAF